MEERYSKNLGALTAENIETLRKCRVCVVGCGGLGGYVIEELARVGVGSLTIADGDSFDETNLNRQLYATLNTLGKSKALAAAERVKLVNPNVKVTVLNDFLTAENAPSLISGSDVVVDALDSAASRRILAQSCKNENLFLVHGAISGWHAQVSVLAPGSDAFDYIYPRDRDDSENTPSLSFTPALCASLEVAEAVKVILNKGKTLNGRLLMVDLMTQEYNIVQL